LEYPAPEKSQDAEKVLLVKIADFGIAGSGDVCNSKGNLKIQKSADG
jgi:hypothetical protein